MEISMPPRIPRACRKHGCSKTTTDRSGYCDEHMNTGWESHQQGKSRHERGYGTAWDKRRARILQRDKHLCQECLKSGRPTEAKTVTTSNPRHMAVPMMIVTFKPCAGLATNVRQQQSETKNHINSMEYESIKLSINQYSFSVKLSHKGEGRVKSLPLSP